MSNERASAQYVPLVVICSLPMSTSINSHGLYIVHQLLEQNPSGDEWILQTSDVLTRALAHRDNSELH